jgi:hypothetical protein
LLQEEVLPETEIPRDQETAQELPITQEMKKDEETLDLRIPEETISDEGIRNLLKNAALAEKLELYDKAINFYTEACAKFTSYKDDKNRMVCVQKISELNKLLPSEEKFEVEKSTEKEEKLLIPSNLIPNQEIKNLLKNAVIAENLELYDKAIRFYAEAGVKFAGLKQKEYEEKCRKKIVELDKKHDIAEHLSTFKQIIPLETIQNEKIKKNLQMAYVAESNKKFKQASLFYNIATGLFSAMNDRKNAELCSKTAKKLADLANK